MPNRALVTGGAGFIGSHLVVRLLKEGYSVRVLDNFCSGKKSNLGEHAGEVEWIESDIRDLDAVRASAKGVDCIWHEAALASVPRSVEDPITTHEVNATGTLNVLVAARDASVPRVVLASSSSVYGETPTLPKDEGMVPAPVSPYAAQKLSNELYGRQFFLHYGITTVSLRYFNIFGPRQEPDSPYAAVLPCFLARIKMGLPPVIHGDGVQTRDFTYVDNAVEANLLASRANGVGGEVFNIASGKQVSVRHLAEAVSDFMGWQGGIESGPCRPGDIQHSYADITRAKSALGYEPRVTFEEGLQRTLEWFAAAV
jgi:UDP-glucose 4-epimerase